MSSSRQLIIQSAVRNITSTGYFTNRWTSTSSIVTALQNRYKLSQLKLTKATVSRHLGKLDVDIDNLHTQHQSGAYRGKLSHESYYYFQDKRKDPPKLPSATSKEWIRIKEIDAFNLDEYLKFLDRMDSLHRDKKGRDMTI